MQISVVGTGYVGLVSGACVADMGNDVVCLDIDPEKIRTLNEGGMPIHEPGLLEVVRRNVAAGRLRFTTDSKMAAEHGDIQFIAVGTPSDEDGSADLQYVLAAAKNIAKHINRYTVIVSKSTVPVGTADLVRTAISKGLDERSDAPEFSVVSNPEFLKEGSAVEDFMRPDRIIIGCDDERAQRLMERLYQPFSRNHDKLIVMDVKSAELSKYAANAMLATRISFMNELANLAEVLGADIELVRHGIGADPRIGNHFLYAGCGYGGSCFPKDVKALIQTGAQNQTSLGVLNAVEVANDWQKQVLVSKVRKHFNHKLVGRHFALWGLAFKPNTDDMREAPSRVVIDALLAVGASITAYDPVANMEARRIFGERTGLTYAEDALHALDGADALIIVTEWKEFRSPSFDVLKSRMKAAVIFDGRNLYEPSLLADLGFSYYPIGRKAVTKSVG